MFIDKKVEEEIKILATKVREALAIYKDMEYQKAYTLLNKTAFEVDQPQYWQSFKRELGELHYNMAVLLYKNSDIREKFQEIKKHFQRSCNFDHEAAELPSQRMSGCEDPFTGERVTEVPLDDPRGPVRFDSDEPSPFVKGQIEERQELDRRRFEQAKAMFEDYSSLNIAIEKDIFPCVVSIDTGRGFGTGFFEHEKWLVSNAHVLPNFNCIKLTTLVNSGFKRSSIALGEEGFFHRPTENAPDVAIINVASSNRAVPFTKFLKDQAFFPPIDSGSVYFYVYVDHVNQKKEMRFLSYNREDDFHLLFNPEIDVNPGCSGSPVFEARVVIGSDPTWQFRTIGAIFARTTAQADKEKLVYAIKIAGDFEQIRQEILLQNQGALRLEDEAKANIASHNPEQARKLFDEAKKLRLNAIQGFKRYSTETIIADLPEGLERLLGKNIIDLQESAFLIEVQERYKLNTRNHIKSKSKPIKELGDDLYAFFKYINELDKLPPRASLSGNEYMFSPKKYFRIDLAGGSTVPGGSMSPFRFDLQDNIGNKGEYCPHPNGTVPVSSKFAIASITKKLDETKGEELAKLLIASLTVKSKALLESTETKKRVEALPMWRLFCYSHGKQIWKSQIYQKEDEIYSSQEFQDHLPHGNIDIVDDKDNDFRLF